MKTNKKEPEHVHEWNGTVCFGCGAEAITYGEFLKRKKEWDEYYDIVKTTPSYLNFQDMLNAMKEKSLEKVKAAKESARKLMEEMVWLPKPTFGDPVVLRSQKKLVIID